jgi:hypothetical protein
MTPDSGRRRNRLADPTAERTSDPVPVGDDVIDHDETGEDITPGRNEEDKDARPVTSGDASRPR